MNFTFIMLIFDNFFEYFLVNILPLINSLDFHKLYHQVKNYYDNLDKMN
jgi:hypothetical protein